MVKIVDNGFLPPDDPIFSGTVETFTVARRKREASMGRNKSLVQRVMEDHNLTRAEALDEIGKFDP